MKSILNNIKTEKKKKKNVGKSKNLEIELIRLKYSNTLDILHNALKELNKNQIVDEKLHESKQEILVGYAGELKWLISYHLLIKYEKLSLELETVLVMKVILTLLKNDLKQKMPLSMVFCIKSLLLNITNMIEVNIVLVAFSNMKLLNIEVKNVLDQQKYIVSLNVLIILL